MKKIFNILIIFLIVLFLQACTSSDNLEYNVLYNQKNVFGHKIDSSGKYYNFPDTMICSYEQLLKCCDEYNNYAFNEEDSEYNSELSSLVRKFDEKYFEENSLIIISFETGDGIATNIKEITIKDLSLNVNLKQKNKNGIYNTEAYMWLMIIQINKVDLHCTNLKINYD